MGFGSRAFLAGGLGFAAAFAVACGSSNGLLSSDQNASFSGQLNSISSALASHDCGAAASAATSLKNAVANLPATINVTLRRNLVQATATVSLLAIQNCHGSTTSSTTSPTTTTTTTTTATATTNPTTSTSATSQTNTNPNTGTATNPTPPGTSSTSNGGAGLGGKGTGTGGNGK